MKRIDKLFFKIGLIDKVTGAANRIFKKIDTLNRHTRRGMMNAAAGGFALMSVATNLQAMMSPAIEMDRALGEIKSLEVADAALNRLEKTALKFSIRWGNSASEFVSSAYDIQSAIAGLNGHELSRFTNASGVLAKATKSDIGTITNYVGTMYGIFQNQALLIGKANWVELLAGQTASAVQMFKTTGNEMSAAFTTLGADATAMKVQMHEQMAILGTLQATMSGSEAGTKYKSFLTGIGKAQKTLGLSFTDSQGRMLPILEILERIKGKFGNIDTVAKADLLQKAFGRKEAVSLIKLLMQDTQRLAANIDKLGQFKGMQKAITMADKMVDPWQRLEHASRAVSIVFGRALQPVLNPLIDKLVGGADMIVRWTELFPNLTKLIGVLTLGVLGLVGAASLLAIIGGVTQLVLVGWGAIAPLAGFFGKLAAALKLTTTATWLFSGALWANPITWIVVGVIALTGALIAAIIYWEDLTKVVRQFVSKGMQVVGKAWANVKSLFKDNSWMQTIFFPIYGAITVIDWLIEYFQKIPAWWQQFSQWLGDLNPFANLGLALDWLNQKWQQLKLYFSDNRWMQGVFLPLTVGTAIVDNLIMGFKKIPAWWAQFKHWISRLNPFEIIGQSMDWLIDKINLIPGVNINREAFEPETIQQAIEPFEVTKPMALPQGGLIQQITNATNQSNNGMHVENLEIKTETVDHHFFENELYMAAG